MLSQSVITIRLLTSSRWLPHKIAAINKNCLAGYVSRFITCEEKHGPDDISRLGYSAQWDPVFFFIKFFVRHVASRLRCIG